MSDSALKIAERVVQCLDDETRGLSSSEYREVLEETVSILESQLTAIREEEDA